MRKGSKRTSGKGEEFFDFGEFVRHQPCPKCGSSDGCAVYDTGVEYCYACQKLVSNPNTSHNNDDGDGDDATESSQEFKKKNANKAPLLEGEYVDIKPRGITKETCRTFAYSIGKTERGELVHIANYFNASRQIVAQHLRGKDKTFSWRGRSKEVVLFGQHIWPSKGKRVVVTEGEIDCLTISQAFNNKWPTVSIPSGSNSARSSLERNLEWLESFETIVLAFDEDEPGKKAVEDCVGLFTPGKVKVMSYQGFKDANELYLAKGAAAVSQAVFQAADYRPDGIVNAADLLDLLLEEPPVGYEIPYPLLNEKIGGLRKGELCMFTAGSGIGKSTIVNEIAFHLMTKHGLSIGVLALEENIKRTMERYISIYINKPIHVERNGITQEELIKAHREALGHRRLCLYNHFGSLQIDSLLGKLQMMIHYEKVDFIILDHISIIVSGLAEDEESERKTLDRLMTALRQLVERTGVGMIAVVHLKRPKNGESYNEGKQVSLTDLRGSASLEQISDIVVAVERNQQDEEVSNLSIVRVLKNRPLGKTGLADVLRYDSETGRLSVSSPFDSPEQDFVERNKSKRKDRESKSRQREGKVGGGKSFVSHPDF